MRLHQALIASSLAVLFACAVEDESSDVEPAPDPDPTVRQGARDDSWPQWGGPSRDFTVKSDKLADSWPEDGPPELWSRPLGSGYSAIISDGDLIFTMYRPAIDAEEEVVIAMRAATGETVWEDRYASAFATPPANPAGPSSTPVLVGATNVSAG